MKAKIRLILVLSVFLVSTHAQAQKAKVGDINTNELWSLMPEKVEADSILRDYSAQLNAYFNSKLEEYNTKLASVQEDSLADQSSILYQQKVKDLQALQTDIEEFKKKAESDLAKKKEELYAPIRDRMQAAIDKVAESNGYDYIMDSSFGNLVYRRHEGLNILPLVKKELDLK